MELSGDPTGSCLVVIGIGLNISLADNQRKEIDQQVVDLKEILHDKTPDKNKVAASLLNLLSDYIRRFRQDGFRAFVDEWNSSDAFKGREILLKSGTQVIAQGEYLGVTTDGSIIVKTSEEEQVFGGGEISLRTAH